MLCSPQFALPSARTRLDRLADTGDDPIGRTCQRVRSLSRWINEREAFHT